MAGLGDLTGRLAERCHRQSELLGRHAERAAPAEDESHWGRGDMATTTRAKIAADLASYQPTEDDVEAVYQAVLYEVATGE